MISQDVSLNIITLFTSDFFNEEDEKNKLGRIIEVEIDADLTTANETTTPEETSCKVGESEENLLCHLFGVLIYELFANEPPFKEERRQVTFLVPFCIMYHLITTNHSPVHPNLLTRSLFNSQQSQH